MAPTTDLSPPAKLSKVHSGIPDKLFGKAQKAEQLIYETRTTPDEVQARPRQVAIPQGISRKAFNSVIAALREQIGSCHVELVDQPLKDGWYMEHVNTHEMMSVLDRDAFVASAIAYPASVVDVQKVMLWANEHSIPIWPISIGRNLGYGGAAPRVRGSVVVDLGRRMSRVLNVDPDDYTCLLEPGVSFYVLYEEVQKRGYGHMLVNTPDMGGGSVIGNTLDRGVG